MSFNQSGFNQTAFNRPTLAEVLIAALMSGEGSLTAAASATISATVTLEGVGSSIFKVSKIEYLDMQEWSGIAGAVFPIGKSIVAKATWQGIGTISIANESVQIFVMEFDGTLAPGERITVNTERFTLKKDGVDALQQFNGSFVDLKVGVNEIVIESDSVTRTLLVRVEHRDRSV